MKHCIGIIELDDKFSFVQFFNVTVYKQGGADAEEAGGNKLEAEPEAEFKGC